LQVRFEFSQYKNFKLPEHIIIITILADYEKW